jgi:1,4-dihydroxy-2-naphthoate octaprenyltransferase
LKVEGRKSLVLKGLTLEPPILKATLLAVCLGGAAAWAVTGVFSIAAFVIAAALGLVAQVELYRLKPHLTWIFAPLLVVVVYWTQAGRLDWTAIWAVFIVAVMWAWRLPVATRFGNRGYVVAYALLLVGVTVGGIPAWCLLCLLSAPLAWRAYKSADATISEAWAIVTGMFLVAGYLIKGLIR